MINRAPFSFEFYANGLFEITVFKVNESQENNNSKMKNEPTIKYKHT